MHYRTTGPEIWNQVRQREQNTLKSPSLQRVFSMRLFEYYGCLA